MFATEFDHEFVDNMTSKDGREMELAVKRYFKEFGVPSHINMDRAREQGRGDSQVLCDEAGYTIVDLKNIPIANRT